MLKPALLVIAAALCSSPMAQAKVKPLGKCEAALCAEIVDQYTALAASCKAKPALKNSPAIVAKFDALRVQVFNNTSGLSSEDAMRVTVSQSKSMDACGISEFDGEN